MGTRKKRERQEDPWVVSSEIVGTPAHAFYDRLNEILDRHHFDRNVEHLCRRYYKGPLGRPSIAPGVYFRALLLGYFEGIDSERGIAWRLAGSLSMRRFIAYALTEETPDHSSITRTRRLFAVETHTAVFRWVRKGQHSEAAVGARGGLQLGADPAEAGGNRQTPAVAGGFRGYFCVVRLATSWCLDRASNRLRISRCAARASSNLLRGGDVI